MRRYWILGLILLLLMLPVSALAAPSIAFLDLISGPATGNGDTSQGQTANVNGTIVTVWGTNLGSTQGSSTIAVGGVPSSAIYYWGNAIPPACGPANLYNGHQKMQCVIFQVARTTPSGANDVVVTVDGKTSKALTFTVRAGTIKILASGSIQAAFNSMASGDILYVKDGVNALGGVTLPRSTISPTAAISVVTFPGARSQIGNSANDGFQRSISGTGNFVTYSKFTIYAGGPVGGNNIGAVLFGSDARLVGSFLTGPLADNVNGTVGMGGGVPANRVAIFGNEFTACGNPVRNNHYHLLYISGTRDVVSPSVNGDREIAWNYIHGNAATRAINIYNGEPVHNAPITDHRIHHNVIIDQEWDAILFGGGVVGENSFHDNLVIRSGLLNAFPDRGALAVAVHVNSYYPIDWTGPRVPTVFHIYGNTFVNIGMVVSGTTRGVFYFTSGLNVNWTVSVHGNIVYQSNGLPYIASNSAIPSRDPAAWSNNLWFGAGAAPFWDTSPVNADPLFVSTVTPDYRLQATSPARSAGSSLGAGADFDGTPRPTTSAWDIGSYQGAASGTRR